MPRTFRQNRPGFITLMAVVAAVFLFIIGVGLLTLGFNRRLYSIRSNHQLAARCAADYGLTKAVHEMNLRLPAVNNSNLPADNNTIPGNNATYSYTVTGSYPNYSVTAHGTSGPITKTVSCDLRLKSIFEYAILTKDTLDIGSVSTVNCPNNCDGIPLKIGTTNNPNTNAQITLKPNSTVEGDILLGQGGIPSLVIGAGATYGNIYAVATDFDLPKPTVPSYLSSAGPGGNISNPAAITSGNYKYQNLSLGAFKTLTITGNVQLYITGDITLGNKANIILAPNAKLTIYLEGELEGKNGTGFSNSGDPSQLAIYGVPTCVDDICASGDINIKNSDDFHGTIYAPDAYVHIYNSVTVFGSIIAKDYKQDNSAVFTYDARLREPTDANLIRYVPSHWQEL